MRPRRPGRGAVQALSDAVADNPIFLRELRRRMRGRALFVAMIAYIAVMSGVAFVIIFGRTVQIARMGTVNILPVIDSMSRDLFTWIAVVQGILVLLVGPIITAGIATGEKEKKTLDFLQVTTLRPGAFVFGALSSTMLYILLVLLCALPILSITFLFGGIAPSDIAASFGSLLLLSMILSAGGLYVASVRERTRSAQSALLFVVGIIVLNFMLLNALTRRIFSAGTGGSALLPFSSMAPGGLVTIFGLRVQAWHADIAAAVLVFLFLALLAARRIFNPENRALSYWQGLLFFGLAQLGLAALLWGARTAQPEAIAGSAVATWGLLMGAVLIYQTVRVEMGNELWRLKRRVAPLRAIDESILHQAGLILLWVAISHWWVTNTQAHRADPAGTMLVWRASLAIVISSVVFCGMLARLFTHLTHSRPASLRWTLITVLGLFLAMPLLVIALFKLGDEMPAGTQRFYLTLLLHVPWVYLTQIGGGTIISEFQGVDLATAAQRLPWIYATLAAGLALLAYVVHLRRWTDPDYGLNPRPERRISEQPFIKAEVVSTLRGSGARGPAGTP